jgi:hypothetical protein
MAPTYRPYYGAGEEQQQQRKVKPAWSVLEMKRRRRVAGYKAYAVEGKVKASIRRGLRWMKAKCERIASIPNQS